MTTTRTTFRENWRVYRMLRRDVPEERPLWRREPFREMHKLLGPFWQKSTESHISRYMRVAREYRAWAAQAARQGDPVRAATFREHAKERARWVGEQLNIQKFRRQHPDLVLGALCTAWLLGASARLFPLTTRTARP